MSTDPLRLAVVCGSVRDGRFGPTVSNWFTAQAQQRADIEVDHIDLADHSLPNELSFNPTGHAAELLGKVSPRLERAEAFVLVTPEYNHSFPASLKSLIDWHYTQWRAKPVGFVSYGGLAGGLRAVEQLRPVLGELHAVPIRDVVSFHMGWEQFGEDGVLKEPEGAETASKTMLDQLVWWGLALREAREKRPFEA
jgi:NAD(P)H-dependent FMN reductase